MVDHPPSVGHSVGGDVLKTGRRIRLAFGPGSSLPALAGGREPVDLEHPQQEVAGGCLPSLVHHRLRSVRSLCSSRPSWRACWEHR